MKSFIVSYDLKQSTYDDRAKDYERLYQKLESYFNYARITESTWIVLGNHQCISIRDDLLSILRPYDRVFVCALNREGAWHNCIDIDNKVNNIIV